MRLHQPKRGKNTIYPSEAEIETRIKNSRYGSSDYRLKIIFDRVPNSGTFTTEQLRELFSKGVVEIDGFYYKLVR